MNDDFLSQVWAERHGQVGAFFSDLIDQARTAFERLVARAYDAPWRSDTGCAPERLKDCSTSP